MHLRDSQRCTAPKKVSNHFTTDTVTRDYCILSLGRCTQEGFWGRLNFMDVAGNERSFTQQDEG